MKVLKDTGKEAEKKFTLFTETLQESKISNYY